jgi:hypothetical protein
MIKPDDIKLAVIGLGYVGLPLAVEFGKKMTGGQQAIFLKRAIMRMHYFSAI